MQSGSEWVLAFVGQHDTPSTAEISAQWQAEGRSGRAVRVLSDMVKQGKLKRLPNDGGPGSRYAPP